MEVVVKTSHAVESRQHLVVDEIQVDGVGVAQQKRTVLIFEPGQQIQFCRRDGQQHGILNMQALRPVLQAVVDVAVILLVIENEMQLLWRQVMGFGMAMTGAFKEAYEDDL